ncbi:hypothetical protein Tco_1366976, partial [Tanacetum coccineum]
MSTRSSARRLLSPVEDPKKLISRRNQSEPSLLFDLEEDDMAGQAPPQGLIPDLRSMEELLQAPTDGVGDAINTQEALTIIKNKSKVQTSRNKPQVASASGSSTQDAHVIALTKQVEALFSSFNCPVNSVQNGYETCGGPHAYYECQAAGGYTQEDVYATTDTYDQGAEGAFGWLQNGTKGALVLLRAPQGAFGFDRKHQQGAFRFDNSTKAQGCVWYKKTAPMVRLVLTVPNKGVWFSSRGVWVSRKALRVCLGEQENHK